MKVYLISWEDEEGAFLENGEISPETDRKYRESINTFSEDD